MKLSQPPGNYRIVGQTQLRAFATMVSFDFLSIGHSNIPADRFIAMLRGAGAAAVADVRSVPVSRFCPWFSAKTLAPLLARDGISYLAYGVVLGGRPRDAKL
jgi:uncharacterized protein (DUF488 family)